MMHVFENHLLRYSESIAFIEKGNFITYRQLLDDIHRSQHEIKSLFGTKQVLFEWNYSTTYKNIVLLFAFAGAKGIIMPENISQRLFPNATRNVTRVFASATTTIELTENKFTQELIKRNSSGIIISTSGTGGTPKDVVLDFNLLSEKYLRLNAKHTTVLTFSLEHISGIEAILSILTPGGTIVLEEERSFEAIANSIKKYQVNLIACTPSFLTQLYLKNYLNEGYFHSVKTINCAGEILTQAWLNKFHAGMPWVQIKQIFGTTESTSFKTITHPNNSKRFKPGEYNIDFVVKNNILYLKNRNLMLGNWSENRINDDQWIETTDIVEMDQEGYLEISNRSEKMISVGGKKVNPEEVEKVIQELSFVKYAKVFGEENLILGQIVIADVMATTLLEMEVKPMILKHCRESLEAYKVPIKINFITELALNSRHKSIK